MKKAFITCLPALLMLSPVMVDNASATSLVTITSDRLFMTTSARIGTNPVFSTADTYYGMSFIGDGIQPSPDIQSFVRIQSYLYDDGNNDGRDDIRDTHVYDSATARYSGNSIVLSTISDDWITDYSLNAFSESSIYLMLGFTISGEDASLHLGGTRFRNAKPGIDAGAGYTLSLYDLTIGAAIAEGMSSGNVNLTSNHDYNLYFHLWNSGYANDAGGETTAGITLRNAEIIHDVPEPSTVLLFCSGLTCLLVFRKAPNPRKHSV